jgi:hypothetical protein
MVKGRRATRAQAHGRAAVGVLRELGDAHNRRKSIENFRHKQVAHWGTPEEPAPIVNDIFAISRMTANAMTALANGAGVVKLSLDSQLMNYRSAADRFWIGAAGLQSEQ